MNYFICLDVLTALLKKGLIKVYKWMNRLLNNPD